MVVQAVEHGGGQIRLCYLPFLKLCCQSSCIDGGQICARVLAQGISQQVSQGRFIGAGKYTHIIVCLICLPDHMVRDLVTVFPCCAVFFQRLQHPLCAANLHVGAGAFQTRIIVLSAQVMAQGKGKQIRTVKLVRIFHNGVFCKALVKFRMGILKIIII